MLSDREQAVIDRPGVGFSEAVVLSRHDVVPRPARDGGERAARRSLRSQIAKLEREVSLIVADTFPHIAAPCGPEADSPGPCLPSRSIRSSRG